MYLITGVSGHFGAAAANAFLKNNAADSLAVLTREVEKISTLAQNAVTVRTGDYGDVQSLKAAFKGIDKVLFVSSNDLLHREQHHKNVIDAAVAVGVKQLLFTSFQFRSTTADSPNGLMPVYLATEDYLKKSGLNYIILRNGIYQEVLQDIIGPVVRDCKTLFAPAGNTQVAFTSRNDLAEAAAKLLVTDDYVNQTIDLVNTTSISFPEVATALSKLLKTDIHYADVTPDEYQAALTQSGLPPVVVELFMGIVASIKTGEFVQTGSALENILQRPPVTTADFLTAIYAQQ